MVGWGLLDVRRATGCQVREGEVEVHANAMQGALRAGPCTAWAACQRTRGASLHSQVDQQNDGAHQVAMLLQEWADMAGGVRCMSGLGWAAGAGSGRTVGHRPAHGFKHNAKHPAVTPMLTITASPSWRLKCSQPRGSTAPLASCSRCTTCAKL